MTRQDAWFVMIAVVASGCGGSGRQVQAETAPAPAVTRPAPAVHPEPATNPPDAPAATPSEPERWLGPQDLIPVAEGRNRAKRTAALGDVAFLYIEARPASARILVDGALRGEGRAMVRATGSRWVRVRVEAAGHEPVEGFVELREREVVKFEIPLTPHGGHLTLITDPPGAEVRLEDRFRGRTPITLKNLAEGVHHLELRSGAWNWQGDVEVRRGETRLIEMSVQAAAPAATPAAPATPVVGAAAPRGSEATTAASTPAAEVPPREPSPAATRPPEPGPSPAGPGVPAPAPAGPEPAATSASGAPATATRPDCEAVCRKFVSAVSGSESIREPIHRRCRERCDRGDLRFSVCAWKARDMNDVSACMTMPE